MPFCSFSDGNEYLSTSSQGDSLLDESSTRIDPECASLSSQNSFTKLEEAILNGITVFSVFKLWGSRKYPYLPHSLFVFYFEPPPPPPAPLQKFQFSFILSLKTLGFSDPPHPPGISNDHPWGGYGCHFSGTTYCATLFYLWK